MLIFVRILAVLTGIGSAASLIAFIGNPVEANFMFTAMLGGICWLCARRLRKGPSLTGHGLEDARFPNVYAPGDPMPVPKQSIFGPNAKPWLIQFVVLILCIVFVAPWLKGIFDAPARTTVEFVSDAACSTIGACTKEAVARRQRSTLQ